MMSTTPLPQPTISGSCSVGVLIATYHRPDALARCLEGLAAQSRPPDDIIVVVCKTDAATHQHLNGLKDSRCPIRRISVSAPGVIAARNAGLAACRTDVVAMVDDDAVPHPDWIMRIGEHFAADTRLGGLGGRDRCHDGVSFDDRQVAVVGRIQWFGRLVGNHHIGCGPVRDVDFLKGANMSYRTQALAGVRFNTRLRGSGAGPHEDMAFSIEMRRRGWRLRYDPQLLVDHYAARRDEPRHYVAIAGIVDAEGFSNHAFNLAVALWDDLVLPRRIAFVLWSLLIGTATCPGLLQAVRFTPRLGWQSWKRFVLAQRGMVAAYRTLLARGSAERLGAQVAASGSTEGGGA